MYGTERMEETMSKRDVIVSRGIWHLMTLVSIFGLSIPLNLLWPPGNSSSPFLRDGAVSATTFYAVTLLIYFFFTDPPSTCYKEFNTKIERFLQYLFSHLSLCAVMLLMVNTAVGAKDYVLSVTFFTVSLYTGGLGLIQLSDKLRMETRHAYLTLFFGWLSCLLVLYSGEYQGVLLAVYQLLFSVVLFSNCCRHGELETFIAVNSSLPT